MPHPKTNIQKLAERYIDDFRRYNKKPYRSLCDAFHSTLSDEQIIELFQSKRHKEAKQSVLRRNVHFIQNCDEFLAQATKTYNDTHSHLYALPQELQYKIFKHLTKEDLARMSRVSDHFDVASKAKTKKVPYASRDYRRLLKNKSMTLKKAHKARIRKVKWLQNGDILSFSSTDGIFCIWDQNTGKCKQTGECLKTHRDIVSTIDELTNGDIITGSGDKTLKIWDRKTAQCKLTLQGHQKEVIEVLGLKNGNIASIALDHTLKIWDGNTHECTQTFYVQNGICSIIEHPSGHIVGACADEGIKIWDLSTGKCHQVLPGHTIGFGSVAILQNHDIVGSSLDRTIRIFDFKKGTCKQTFRPFKNDSADVKALHDGNIVIIPRFSIENRFLLIWAPHTGEFKQQLRLPSGYISAFDVSPKGDFLCAIHNFKNDQYNIQLWRFPDLKPSSHRHHAVNHTTDPSHPHAHLSSSGESPSNEPKLT